MEGILSDEQAGIIVKHFEWVDKALTFLSVILNFRDTVQVLSL